MSKYDFEIDLSDRTSTGIILNKIKPGSVVLEFGCATGRMTRYMKEALACSVYIVEFDSEAYEKALEFAEGGVCDDIQTYSWMEAFKDLRFDAIIFADVLEHLRHPEEVLVKAAKLLKDTGCICVSVPNITHNDILLKAYAERFDYTRTGLLDEDHIHFWGLENLKAIPQQCGLNVKSIEGTYCVTGDSEQTIFSEDQILFKNILRQRLAGEVYQFVITLDKGEITCPSCNIQPPIARSYIYLDTGSGFNPQQCIAVDAVRYETGSYRVCAEIEAQEGLCRIRLDPAENQGCILLDAVFSQGERELPWTGSEMARLPKGIYLPGGDPMILVEVSASDGPIRVWAEFLLPDQAYLALMEKNVTEQEAALERLGLNDADMAAGITEWLDLKDRAAYLTGELKKTQERLESAEKENVRINGELCGYVVLSDRKERLLIERKRQLAETEQRLAEREQQLLEIRQLLSVREQQLAQTQWQLGDLERKTRVYMKCRRFAVRVYRALKWRIKRILGR